jgi:hypothetical protein
MQTRGKNVSHVTKTINGKSIIYYMFATEYSNHIQILYYVGLLMSHPPSLMRERSIPKLVTVTLMNLGATKGQEL